MDKLRSRHSSLAAACRRLAELVETKRRPLKSFRRRCVFDLDGRPGCPFGHALAIANLKPRGPYRWREHTKAVWQETYLTNEGTYQAVFGVIPTPALEEALWDLAARNATTTDDARRRAIARGLRRVAEELSR